MTRYGLFGAVLALGCGMLLAACSGGTEPVETTVPAPARSPTVPDETRFIVVQRGQSLGRIAEIHQVPKQAIIAANHLAPPYRLKAGMRLAIPVAAKQRATEPIKGTKEASAKPARSSAPAETTGDAAQSRHAKIKHSEPEVIPLDDPPPSPVASQPVDTALRRDYSYFGLDPALSR
jgi:murein DD-endopeptidase MepM/ murein hydrolase activator NlpD